MNAAWGRRRQTDPEESIQPQQFQTRKRLMQLFPRVSYDSYTSKKLKDLDIDSEQEKTPKNNRLKPRFDQRNYNEFNDESMSIVSKETDRIGTSFKNNYQRAFTYQSVHHESKGNRKGTLDNEKPRQSRIEKVMTQPNEEVDTLFTSLEENLSECDKILSKLGGVASVNVKPIEKSVKKVIPVQRNREIQIPSSLSIRRESRTMLEEFESKQKERDRHKKEQTFRGRKASKMEEQNLYNSFKISKESIFSQERSQEEEQIQRFKLINPQKIAYKGREEPSKYSPRQTQQVQPQQYPKSKQLVSSGSHRSSQPTPPQPNPPLPLHDSIFQIRRRRINQILQINKDRNKGEDPIELSFSKLKQRGENMFNRVLRVKETGKGGEFVYESDMGMGGK